MYSFAGKANLLDTAHNLCEYIKEHYPEVDKVRQIRYKYCQEWLDSKAKGGSFLNTIETYKSNLQTLNETFENRVWFVGLQGSYGCGEATATSDIDIVVILDELSAMDNQAYKDMLDTLSHRELICGFLSGKKKL